MTSIRITPNYRLLVGGADFTERMRAFQFRYGGRFTNEIGHVATPFSGFIRLANDDGALHQLSNSPLIDGTENLEVDLQAFLDNGSTVPLMGAWLSDIPQQDVLLSLIHI